VSGSNAWNSKSLPSLTMTTRTLERVVEYCKKRANSGRSPSELAADAPDLDEGLDEDADTRTKQELMQVFQQVVVRTCGFTSLA
jgi:hypothetical protein